MADYTIAFHGTERITLHKVVREVADSFTFEFWIKSDEKMELDSESQSGASGVQGKKYAIAPVYVSDDDAGVGIAVGVNGIAVYEHSEDYMPAVLVHPYNFSEWTHVAVVYDEKSPSLYLNGHFVKRGLTGLRRHVYPSVELGGHEYGHFIGELKGFRLWSTARTEEQIKAFMHQNVIRNEPHLLWSWDISIGKMTWNGTPKNVYISVILASHNKFPLNFFTLNALTQQSFPDSQMEVIFVEDGSTDVDIDFFDPLSPTFPFKYIQCESPVGRAKARNIGIQAAVGQILLFIDAEMICPPDFIQHHAIHHLAKPDLVVSAAMKMRRVFTFLQDGFNSDQISKMYSIYRKRADILNKLDEFYTKNKTPIQLLSTEEILNMDSLSKYCYETNNYDQILQQYGDQFDGFAFPWMNFITNNVSLPRYLIDTVGGFDEHFVGYGWEDWELGYRLNKNGATFLHDPNLISYHQEHPISPHNWKQARNNFLSFQQKHPDIELKLYVLDMIPQRRSYSELNTLVKEYYTLCKHYPTDYSMFKRVLNTLLEQVAILLAETRPIANISAQASITPNEITQLHREFIRIRKSFPHLANLVQFLSNQ